MSILSGDTFQVIFGVGPPSSAVKFAQLDADDMHKELEPLRRAGRVTKQAEAIAKKFDAAVTHAKIVTSTLESMKIMSMSVCLGKASGSDGYFVWNDSAPRKHPKMFMRMPVVGDIFWSARMTNASLGLRFGKQGVRGERRSLGCDAGKPCSAVLDTGTSLIAAPSAVAKKFAEIIQEWTEEGGTCDDVSSLPNLEFRLNNHLFVLPPQAYVGRVQRSPSRKSSFIKSLLPHLFRQRKTVNTTLHRCESLILSYDDVSTDGLDMWILGMPFFRKYYTNFEYTKSSQGSLRATSMSFSIANDECEPRQRPSRLYSQLVYGRRWTRSATMSIDPNKVLAPRALSRLMLRNASLL
eukprot:TRINITY_DN1494_c0_g1_i2.p1 TRINITY_DN1494_c0_g1~~TRINITY_DN1494_c0_g1_i2.p1  ORF type:complete len:352 (+),score=82.38 TRINITY_DN1494_c0_g1_i2:595-1650(+)